MDDRDIGGAADLGDAAEIAGGDDILPERAEKSLAKDRIMANGDEVIARNPDIIFGSWCGKKFRPEKWRSEEVGLVSMR